MEISIFIFILAIVQGLNLFIYSWLAKYAVKDPWNRPPILCNPVINRVISTGTTFLFVALIVCAFLFTKSAYLFLGLSIAGWVAFSPNPKGR